MKTIRKKTDVLKLFLSKFPLFIFILLINLPNLVLGQHRILASEELRFKASAKQLIERLADNYISLLENSDSFDRNELIKNMIMPVNGFPSLFRDDQIQIEDDFQTRENLTNDITQKNVESYFRDVYQNYGRSENGEYKNEGKTFEFTNIIYSKTMAVSDKSPMFIKVFFEIRYKGVDTRTNLPFKQPNKRIAEVQIEKGKGNWQFVITALRFEKEIEEDYSKNVIIEKDKEQDKNLLGFISEEGKKTVFKNQNLILRAFKSNDKWGLKNVETDEIILLPTYDFIYEYSEDELALVNLEGYWGYIDTAGKLILKCEYDNAESFSKDKKGKAKVQKGIEWFFIDRNGNRTK